MSGARAAPHQQKESDVKSLPALGLLAALTAATSGCVYVNGENIGQSDWRDEQRTNSKLISELEIGMERNAVLGRLGPPSDSEAFTRNGEEMRVLFYRTQRKHSDGETTRDETTPLVFENDRLIGWGQAVYADIR
jgi:hypothetical protein